MVSLQRCRGGNTSKHIGLNDFRQELSNVPQYSRFTIEQNVKNHFFSFLIIIVRHLYLNSFILKNVISGLNPDGHLAIFSPVSLLITMLLTYLDWPYLVILASFSTKSLVLEMSHKSSGIFYWCLQVLGSLYFLYHLLVHIKHFPHSANIPLFLQVCLSFCISII